MDSCLRKTPRLILALECAQAALAPMYSFVMLGKVVSCEKKEEGAAGGTKK